MAKYEVQFKTTAYIAAEIEAENEEAAQIAVSERFLSDWDWQPDVFAFDEDITIIEVEKIA